MQVFQTGKEMAMGIDESLVKEIVRILSVTTPDKIARLKPLIG